jgi:hypothetical protein
LFVLGVILLLPIRVKASYSEETWSVSVKYVFFRIFHIETPEKKPPETPPKPADIPEGEQPDPAQFSASSAQSTVTANTPAEMLDAAKEDAGDDAGLYVYEKPKKEKRKKREKKPRKPKEPLPEESDAAEANGQTEQPKKKKKLLGFIDHLIPHSVPDVLKMIPDIFGALTPAMRFLTRHLHFRHVKIYAAIATDDAAKTAQLYGRINAAAFPLLGMMQCWFDFQADEFRILADFYNDSLTFRGALELRVSPLVLILLVLILGCKFVWKRFRRYRSEIKEAKRREKETAPIPAEA